MIVNMSNFDINQKLLENTLMDSFFLKELVENLAFVTKAKHVLISRAAIKEA